MERSKIELEKYSIYFLYIIFAVGVIGHVINSTKSLMLSLTPFTLLLANIVVIIPHFRNKHTKVIGWIAVVYILTLLLEIIGVKTGLIFGSYNYGNVLGFQVFDVPLIIGFNWTIISLSIAVILMDLKTNIFVKSLFAGIMAVLLDFFIEPIAIHLDYWTWSGGAIPIQNYIAWFIISFGAVLAILLIKTNLKNKVASHYYFIQLAFFILLNLFI